MWLESPGKLWSTVRRISQTYQSRGRWQHCERFNGHSYLFFFKWTSTSSSEHLNCQHSARPGSIPPCLKSSWRLESISRANKLFLLRSSFLFWNTAAQSALSRYSQIKEPTQMFQDSKWKRGGLRVRYLHDFLCSSKGQCVGTMGTLLHS